MSKQLSEEVVRVSQVLYISCLFMQCPAFLFFYCCCVKIQIYYLLNALVHNKSYAQDSFKTFLTIQPFNCNIKTSISIMEVIFFVMRIWAIYIHKIYFFNMLPKQFCWFCDQLQKLEFHIKLPKGELSWNHRKIINTISN